VRTVSTNPPPIDDAAADALQGALVTEHAALWSYALAVAFLPPDQAKQARADADVHRELRSRVAQTLSDLGKRPVSAQPAYDTPAPVTDAASAAVLVAVAESDTMAAWRSVLERTTFTDLRAVAIATLTAATVRCARWRRITGEQPGVPDFPGLR
jgi:hypothetical protein